MEPDHAYSTGTRRFRYTLHNLVGHPMMEVAHLLGLHSAAHWLHNRTLPRDVREAGLFYMKVEAGEYFHTNSGMTSQEVEAAMRLQATRVGMRQKMKRRS